MGQAPTIRKGRRSRERGEPRPRGATTAHVISRATASCVSTGARAPPIMIASTSERPSRSVITPTSFTAVDGERLVPQVPVLCATRAPAGAPATIRVAGSGCVPSALRVERSCAWTASRPARVARGVWRPLWKSPDRDDRSESSRPRAHRTPRQPPRPRYRSRRGSSDRPAVDSPRHSTPTCSRRTSGRSGCRAPSAARARSSLAADLRSSASGRRSPNCRFARSPAPAADPPTGARLLWGTRWPTLHCRLGDPSPRE